MTFEEAKKWADSRPQNEGLFYYVIKINDAFGCCSNTSFGRNPREYFHVSKSYENHNRKHF